jgi:hypothetical protein
VTGVGCRLKGVGKKMALCRCTAVDIRWNRKAASRRSDMAAEIRLPMSRVKDWPSSIDEAKSFNSYGHKQMKLHQRGIFTGLRLSCCLGRCTRRPWWKWRQGKSDCYIPGDRPSFSPRHVLCHVSLVRTCCAIKSFAIGSDKVHGFLGGTVHAFTPAREKACHMMSLT